MKKRKKTKTRKIMNIALFVLASFTLVVGIHIGYLYKKAENALHQISVNSSVQGNEFLQGNKVNNVVDTPILFLLAGVDSREGGDGMMNTDVLMLVSFNPKTKSASFLSIPRDLLIQPESLPSRKANYYYAHHYIKDKAEVIPNTKKFFSDVFGLPIDYMVVVNFEMLTELVDLLGGLEIDVDMDMKYRDTYDGTNINLKQGLQRLDGGQVLDFVRYRKSNQGTKESSDFERNDRQQQVMKQILEKLGAYQGISQWGKVLDIIGENVKSDIPEDYIKQWVFNFPKIKPEQMNSLKVESVWKNPFVYFMKEELEEAISSMQRELGIASGHSIRVDRVGVIE
ncbi:LCP family protein [Paenibacillus sp. NPDC058071]|uniref:LCP family protein n=1 Tax=Paenibacillus sp. NPDC058071 TaxID=3346326 RepID=UPI0036DA53E8